MAKSVLRQRVRTAVFSLAILMTFSISSIASSLKEARFPTLKKPFLSVRKDLLSEYPSQRDAITSILMRIQNTMTPGGYDAALFFSYPDSGKRDILSRIAKLLNLPMSELNLQAYDWSRGNPLPQALEPMLNHFKEKKVPKSILYLHGLSELMSAQQFGIIYQALQTRFPDVLIYFNFDLSPKFFGVVNDPRINSLEQVAEYLNTYASKPEEFRRIFSESVGFQKEFIPPAIGLLGPSSKDYKKSISDAIQSFVVEKEKMKMELVITKEFHQFLFEDCVHAGFGPVNTYKLVREKLEEFVAEVFKRIPQNSPIAKHPIRVGLHYNSEREAVEPQISPQQTLKITVGEKDYKTIPKKWTKLSPISVERVYPSPVKVNRNFDPNEIHTALHEFGHAITGIRLGARILHTTILPPEPGVGGYVSFVDGTYTAQGLITSIYSSLGSRAMERIFMSDNPLSSSSVLKITGGPRLDLQTASDELYQALFVMGYDPNGGSSSLSGTPESPASYDKLDPATQLKLGKILRMMEDFVVADLLKAHSKAWYKSKVISLLKAQTMNEESFLKMIGYPYPGDEKISISESRQLEKDFANWIQPRSEEFIKAQRFKQGKTKTTAMENLKAYIDFFEAAVKKVLHQETCENVLKKA